jgi:hypothetical protein
MLLHTNKDRGQYKKNPIDPKVGTEDETVYIL